MGLPDFLAPLSLLAPARPASDSAGIHKTFGHLVPPFLLASRPDLLFTAIDAAKRHIDVKSTGDEIGNAVAVVRRQQRFVDRN